jgi:hypothetical protein
MTSPPPPSRRSARPPSAAAEANLAKNELRILREQSERLRADLAKSTDALATLRANRTADMESLCSAERAEQDAAFKELALANEAGLRAGLDGACSELTARYDARVASLQSEVLKLSTRIQDGIEEAVRLREAAARVNAAAVAASVPARPAPEDDPFLLRSALQAAQATAAALRNELAATRAGAEAAAVDATQQYAARIAELQAAQSSALLAAVRTAEDDSSMRLQAAVAEVSQTMADDIRRLQEASPARPSSAAPWALRTRARASSSRPTCASPPSSGSSRQRSASACRPPSSRPSRPRAPSGRVPPTPQSQR